MNFKPYEYVNYCKVETREPKGKHTFVYMSKNESFLLWVLSVYFLHVSRNYETIQINHKSQSSLRFLFSITHFLQLMLIYYVNNLKDTSTHHVSHFHPSLQIFHEPSSAQITVAVGVTLAYCLTFQFPTWEIWLFLDWI